MVITKREIKLVVFENGKEFVLAEIHDGEDKATYYNKEALIQVLRQLIGDEAW